MQLSAKTMYSSSLPYKDLACEAPRREAKAFCSNARCIIESPGRKLGKIYRVRGLGRAVEVYEPKDNACTNCSRATFWARAYQEEFFEHG